jgi:hypothetical protein
VVRAGGVQDAVDLVNLRLRIAGPGGAGVVSDSPEDGQQAKRDDGFLVDDVELVANGSHAETSTGGQNGGLGDGAVAGDRYRIEQRLRLFLRVLGQVRVVTGRGDLGREGWEGAERECGTETGGACSG